MDTCKKCNKQHVDCGCGDSFISTPPACNETPCNGNPCPQSFSSECIIYTGPSIPGTSVQTGDSVEEVIGELAQQIVNTPLVPGPMGLRGAKGDQGDPQRGIALMILLNNGSGASIPTIPIAGPGIRAVTQGLNIPAYDSVQFDSGNPVSTTIAGGFNILTGIWTCPETGYYQLGVNSFLKAGSNQNTAGWQVSPNIGYFSMGICVATNTTDLYSSDSITTTSEHGALGFSTQRSVFLNAGAQVIIRALNKTELEYLSQTGDVVVFEVQKIG